MYIQINSSLELISSREIEILKIRINLRIPMFAYLIIYKTVMEIGISLAKVLHVLILDLRLS